jgi:hypothetical protein
MTSVRLVIAACLASLTVGLVLGQAPPQMKMASEACVKAVDPQKLLVLVEASSRIGRNVLSLRPGMRADDSDYEGANDLWRVSSDLSALLQWIADLGLIANNIQSASDKAAVRIVLQKSATSVLLRQELMAEQANFALSRVRGAALVAEGRALRDEIDRFATALQPCAN